MIHYCCIGLTALKATDACCSHNKNNAGSEDVLDLIEEKSLSYSGYQI